MNISPTKQQEIRNLLSGQNEIVYNGFTYRKTSYNDVLIIEKCELLQFGDIVLYRLLDFFMAERK